MKMESIAELKKICAKDKKYAEREFWLYRFIYRRISIYFTKALLKVNFSANEASGLEAVFVVISGVLLALGMYWYSVVGALMLQVPLILDAVDGEIARYQEYKGTRTDSSRFVGRLLERNVHSIYPLVFVCMSFGIYSNFLDVTVFIFSFLILLSFTLYYVTFSNLNPIDMALAGVLERVPVRLGIPQLAVRNFFNSTVMSLLILIAAALDMLYIVLILYGVTLPLFVGLYLYLAIQHESKLRAGG